MLKVIQFEILIIGILILNIIISYNFNIGFYDYFSYLGDTFKQIYLIKFFENITTLGDSLWYFTISITFIIIFYLLKKSNILDKYKYGLEKIRYYNFLLFSSIIISGILTQLIKHILGRPRPSAVGFENEIGLKFFTFDSSFHSFPSGHTSTIFVVVLVISLMIPKLKFFFFFLAFIISFSRVVVEAHFITDVIGGIAVALIGFKLSKLILYKIFNININKKNVKFFIVNDNFTLVIFVFLLLSILLTIGPTFDIFFSDLFYLGKNQFLIQSYYFISFFFRKIVLGFILIYILILPIFSFFIPIKQIYYDYNFKIKEVLYIWVSTILSLVVLINIILKNIWGRARPNEILELGGDDIFTPWYQISSQCSSNCSFVSGDAAVGFSLIVFYLLIKKESYLWLALLFGLTVGTIRIIEGGHFLSDIIFSCLIVFLFNLLAYSYYHKKIDG